MNSRERMRISNKKAYDHLLKVGYTEVWLKAHTKFHDIVHCLEGKTYKALDLFNLWDGIVLTNDDHYFVQIKTNAWPKEQPMIDWCAKHNAKALAINVKLIRDDWQVLMRKYE
jgi:hypothetical protein